MVDVGSLSYLSAMVFVFRPLNTRPGGHVLEVENEISGAVAVIHWLTHLYFEGCMAALGLRPQKF